VSPLWRDKLLIGMSPERLVLLRQSRGWRPVVRAKAIISVARATEPLWRAAVEMLASTLSSDANWQEADAAIVLSNRFARYQLLPWSDAVGNDAERDRYARELFSQVYGDVSGEWEIRVTDTGYGAPWLACAVDRALIDQLTEAVTRGKSRLNSVMPHLAAALNRTRRTLKANDAWFVQIEPGRLDVALFVQGRWRALSSRRIGEDEVARELPLMLDREVRLSGLNAIPRDVYLSAPGMKSGGLDGAGKWVYRWLPPRLGFGLSVSVDAPYAMAFGD